MRIHRSVWFVALAFALSPAGWALAQEAAVEAEIEVIPVAGKVHALLSGVAGNVAVSSGQDGILVVDDKIAPLTEDLRAALATISEAPLAFVVNTHWHHDHTGGNPAFGDEAPILAHHNVRERLSAPQEILGRTWEALPPAGLPVVTFADSVSIHFNGEEIRAIHLPRGHTDGDIAVWFTGSNVIHMGDHFFNGLFPFIDLATGGDAVSYTGNVAAVLERIPEDASVIPGHGPLGTVEDLRAFHRMLEETIGFVRGRIDEGRSLEEIQADGLPAEWKEWAWDFITEDTWIQIVHASVTGSAEAPRSSHGH